MAKKQDKKNKKEEIPERTEAESVEGIVPETESVSSESEAESTETSPDEGVDSDAAITDDVPEEIPLTEDELSSDDLLEDVRRSLIEENAEREKEKKPNWWQKLGVGARKAGSSDESTESTPVNDIPDEDDILDTGETEPSLDQQDDTGESIDDLIEMLEAEDEISSETKPAPVSTPIVDEQPEKEKVDVAELKKRAFSGSTPDDKEENFSDVRAVALEDGDEVFVEVELKAEDPVEDRIKSFENALRPYRRYINLGVAFIGLIVIIATSALLYDAYQQSLPPEPTIEPSNLPYPVILNVPGGLSFNLGRGTLDDGRWNPRQPEWLEGTEICRWVAIPYSRQLEAVVRTLTRDDQLKLVMSNSDSLAYDVFSITQMTIEDMQDVSSNTPCLLLVLADTNTDTRWVVAAYP